MVYELDIEKALSGEETSEYASTFKMLFFRRYQLGFRERVCCCQKFFIFGNEDFVICSKCKDIINKEIDEFYSIPELQDIFAVKNNGIYERIKVILFLERDAIMNRKNRPDSWYLFIDKINLSYKRIFQVVNRVWKYQKNCYKSVNDVQEYTFKFEHSSGASDRKMILAAKKCAELYPDIFSRFYNSFQLMDRFR